MEQHLGEAAAAASKVGAGTVQAGVFGLSVGAGIAGGVMMMIVTPPKTRAEMGKQGAAALLLSAVLGPLAMRVLDHIAPWLCLAEVSTWEVLEVAAPVFCLIGALSWGIVRGLAMFREMLAARGAQAAADRLGMKSRDES